jgi:hypothetical protein
MFDDWSTMLLRSDQNCQPSSSAQDGIPRIRNYRLMMKVHGSPWSIDRVAALVAGDIVCCSDQDRRITATVPAVDCSNRLSFFVRIARRVFLICDFQSVQTGRRGTYLSRCMRA